MTSSKPSHATSYDTIMHRATRFLLRVLASRTFFVIIVGLLIFQALWLALSYNYPMLWDEYYHFGLIQYYGHHLNPIISQQPTSLDVYGNVARSPKYLYHYLMSFPYRLIVLFTRDQAAQIICLRILNIAMFAGGIVAFRQAMLRLSRSKALVNFVLLLFVLLPLTPLLAAQINYDTMEFLFAGLVFYWTFRYIQAPNFEIRWLLLVLGGGLFASVVKYTFLPILLAILIVLGVQTWHRYGRQVFKLARSSYMALSKWSMFGLTLLVLLGIGLSVERFGINLVKYHGIDPKCEKVLNVERCMEFSPYKQQYVYAQEQTINKTHPPHGLVGYTFLEWTRQLYDQYFTTGTQTAPEIYVVNGPLKIPFFSMLGAGAIGVLAFLIAAKRLLQRSEIWVVVLSICALAAALFIVDYAQYLNTGYPLAIQGRYLTPIIPLGMLLGGLAVQHIFPRQRLKLALACITLLGLLWGGGLITHIVLSTPDWYWHNQIVINANQWARDVLEPITY